MRDEKILTVAAGDNVVRLLPPLIIGEEEMSRGARHDRPRLRAPGRSTAAEPDKQEPSDEHNGIRHFIDLTDISREELRGMIESSLRDESRAQEIAQPGEKKPLAGQMLAMIFDKPSTRTRVSFDVAMRQLGGETIVLTGQEMQLGRGETIADTARVMSRYVDAIMIRTLDHEIVTELARHATCR